MMRLQNVLTFLLAFSGLLIAGAAHADIFRCSDAEGKTLYTNSPCPDRMRTVNTLPAAQACTTEECDQRRERELIDARGRARAEKEELAALSSERRQRDIEDQRWDEARYEAALAYAGGVQGANEVVYPVYAIGGYSIRCGSHCLNTVGHRRARISAHGPGNHLVGNQRRLTSNVGTPHRAAVR